MDPGEGESRAGLERFRSYLHLLAEIGEGLGRTTSAAGGIVRRGLGKLCQSLPAPE